MKTIAHLLKVFAGCVAAALLSGAYAQTYPTKPLRLLVPFGPSASSTFHRSRAAP
jgi:tripartite-type tricarboxylate transporter receptor subunit TctC